MQSKIATALKMDLNPVAIIWSDKNQIMPCNLKKANGDALCGC